MHDMPQMLARALTRKGNALQKKGDLEGAVTAYSKVCWTTSMRAVTACAYASLWHSP